MTALDVYPGGTTAVYSGGTIPTTSRMAFAAAVAQAAEGGGVLIIGSLPPGPDDDWPPSWFGSIVSARMDTAARTEEILRAGFGRDDHR